MFPAIDALYCISIFSAIIFCKTFFYSFVLTILSNEERQRNAKLIQCFITIQLRQFAE